MKYIENPTIKPKDLPYESDLAMGLLRMLYIKNRDVSSVFDLQPLTWTEVATTITSINASHVIELAETGLITVVTSNDAAFPVAEIHFADCLQYVALRLDYLAQNISMLIRLLFCWCLS